MRAVCRDCRGDAALGGPRRRRACGRTEYAAPDHRLRRASRRQRAPARPGPPPSGRRSATRSSSSPSPTATSATGARPAARSRAAAPRRRRRPRRSSASPRRSSTSTTASSSRRSRTAAPSPGSFATGRPTSCSATGRTTTIRITAPSVSWFRTRPTWSTVPFFCPDTPPCRRIPVFLSYEDDFTKPNPFQRRRRRGDRRRDREEAGGDGGAAVAVLRRGRERRAAARAGRRRRQGQPEERSAGVVQAALRGDGHDVSRQAARALWRTSAAMRRRPPRRSRSPSTAGGRTPRRSRSCFRSSDAADDADDLRSSGQATSLRQPGPRVARAMSRRPGGEPRVLARLPSSAHRAPRGLLGEAFGGPADYTGSMGDESRVVRMHSGNGEHLEMDERAQTCFAQALDDAGLPGDPRLRSTLEAYFRWATEAMAAYPRSADDVPAALPLALWSWEGPV